MLNLIATTGGSSQTIFLVAIIALMFGLTYFTSIRPQKKRQKEHQAMLSELSKGDKIMTIGGFYGKIFSVDEENDEIVVELIPDNTKVTITKSAIAKKNIAE